MCAVKKGDGSAGKPDNIEERDEIRTYSEMFEEVIKDKYDQEMDEGEDFIYYIKI